MSNRSSPKAGLLGGVMVIAVVVGLFATRPDRQQMVEGDRQSRQQEAERDVRPAQPTAPVSPAVAGGETSDAQRSPVPGSAAQGPAGAGDSSGEQAPRAADGEQARAALNERLFTNLPFERAEQTMSELGLDRIAGLEALFEQAHRLRAAIAGGDRGAIRAAAQDYLRQASELQTPKAQQQYHAILKEYHRKYGQPAEDVGDIKDVLIPAFGLAQELARVQ